MKSYEDLIKKLKQKDKLRKNLDFIKIHIENLTPFLLFVVKPENVYLERLLWGFPSYIVFYRFGEKEKDFLKKIVQIASEKYKNVLIIRISQNTKQKADFGIYQNRYGDITDVVDVLSTSLKELKIYSKPVQVKIYKKKESFLLKDKKIHYINLSINPVYQQKNKFYPYIYRKLHHTLNASLKKAFYTFSKKYTNLKISHYFSIGKKIFTRRVWNVDLKLASIADSFDFILSITPVNVEQAWVDFKTTRFSKRPQFLYRPFEFEISHLKKALFSIPVEEVEDPTLYEIFSRKRDELDLQLTVLENRDREKTLWISAQLYGIPDKSLVKVAQKILTTESTKEEEPINLSAKDLLNMAKKEINFYKSQYPYINSKIKLRSDIVSKAIVSDGNLYIYKYSYFSKKEAVSLLHHEIGTHILTYINGKLQRFNLLHIGLDGYEEMQEGLAVMAEYLSNTLTLKRLKILSARVIAVDMILKGADFIEVFNKLREYGFGEKESFMITTRVFRGGGFVKDAVYLRGFLKVFEYLKGIDDFHVLYAGKYSFEHINFIRELIARDIVFKPVLVPRYIYEGFEKLKKLNQGLDIDRLIEELK